MIICSFLKSTLKLLISSKYNLSVIRSGRPSAIGWVFSEVLTFRQVLLFLGIISRTELLEGEEM